MTQLFTADGKMLPITVIEAGPCPVVQVKTLERDGYSAVKLGFSEVGEKALNKPEAGLFKKIGVAPQKVLKEFRMEDSGLEVGAVVTCETFAAGDKIDVSGVSKGHGFTGVIKRWNNHRLKETHGVGPVHRQVGSMGANSTPSRVFKNKKMAGQYGNEQVTILNLAVVKIDPEKNLIAVKGAIPGARGGIVFIRDSVKA